MTDSCCGQVYWTVLKTAAKTLGNFKLSKSNTYCNAFENFNHYISLRLNFLVHSTSNYKHSYNTQTKTNSGLIGNSVK